MVRRSEFIKMKEVPLTIVINPSIKYIGQEVCTHREGCLSLPHYSAHVKRFAEVEVNPLL